MADLKRLSKFLALMLRHEPEKFGLTLDSQGYTPLDQVWAQISTPFKETYTRADLESVVAGDEKGKKRYEINGEYIRALFGHSDVEEIVYPPAQPPDLLYHGTIRAALQSIRQEGLSARSRQYVHMTTNHAIALDVAARHGDDSIILTIHAADAQRAGVEFYHPETQHFLAKSIPPEFIDFSEAD